VLCHCVSHIRGLVPDPAGGLYPEYNLRRTALLGKVGTDGGPGAIQSVPTLSRSTSGPQWQSFFSANPFVLSRSLPLRLEPCDILPLGRPGRSAAIKQLRAYDRDYDLYAPIKRYVFFSSAPHLFVVMGTQQEIVDSSTHADLLAQIRDLIPTNIRFLGFGIEPATALQIAHHAAARLAIASSPVGARPGSCRLRDSNSRSSDYKAPTPSAGNSYVDDSKRAGNGANSQVARAARPSAAPKTATPV